MDSGSISLEIVAALEGRQHRSANDQFTDGSGKLAIDGYAGNRRGDSPVGKKGDPGSGLRRRQSY
jgi:hypothetical protein